MAEATAVMSPVRKEGREQFLSSFCPPASSWVIERPIQPEFKQVEPTERWRMDWNTTSPRSGINIGGGVFIPCFTDTDIETREIKLIVYIFTAGEVAEVGMESSLAVPLNSSMTLGKSPFLLFASFPKVRVSTSYVQ